MVTFNSDSGDCEIFVGLRKVFNTLDHDILFEILNPYDIRKVANIGFHHIFKVERSALS